MRSDHVRHAVGRPMASVPSTHRPQRSPRRRREERMTQGPQPPDFQGPQPGTPPQFQGQPAMPPQFPPPAPPARSNKTIIIVAAAVVVALIVGAAIAYAFTRSSGDEASAGASSAASSSTTKGTYDYRLRGTMKSKASICVATALTTQKMPKFETPLNYGRPTLDADIAQSRADLSTLAGRISPDAQEPLRSTVQDWINSFVELLDSFSRRLPAAEVKFVGDITDNLAGRMNAECSK